MNNTHHSIWPTAPAPLPASVPQRYFGVWSRTLLETPERRDTSTFVRWMQLAHWHVDLRIPAAPTDAKQGFCGITRVTQRAEGEVCTWMRLVDYSPPRATVDEGTMVFTTPEQVIETGIHGVYHEVWDRLPGSTGSQMALAQAAGADGDTSTRLFVSGEFVMRVRPCRPIGPAFEISFGKWESGVWQVEQSTLAALVGQRIALTLERSSPHVATVQMAGIRSEWTILEWFKH